MLDLTDKAGDNTRLGGEAYSLFITEFAGIGVVSCSTLPTGDDILLSECGVYLPDGLYGR